MPKLPSPILPLGISEGNAFANVSLRSGSVEHTYSIQSGPFQNLGVGIGFKRTNLTAAYVTG
jgi:hypothetical protein